MLISLTSDPAMGRVSSPRLQPETGTLIPHSRCSPSTANAPGGIVCKRSRSRHPFGNAMRAGIFCIDWVLRRWYGVYAYSTTEDDLLRVAVRALEVPITLSDGTRVTRGDLVVDLHIWNERIATLGPLGPSLAWASRVRHRIEHSLITLAQHLESRGCLDQCAAVHAEAVFVGGRGAKKLARIAGHFGLTRPGNAQRADLGHGLLAYGLAWACDPDCLAGKRFRPMRHEFWISGTAFRKRFSIGRPSLAADCVADSGSRPCLPKERFQPGVTGAGRAGAADSPIALQRQS